MVFGHYNDQQRNMSGKLSITLFIENMITPHIYFEVYTIRICFYLKILNTYLKTFEENLCKRYLIICISQTAIVVINDNNIL